MRDKHSAFYIVAEAIFMLLTALSLFGFIDWMWLLIFAPIIISLAIATLLLFPSSALVLSLVLYNYLKALVNYHYPKGIVAFYLIRCKLSIEGFTTQIHKPEFNDMFKVYSDFIEKLEFRIGELNKNPGKKLEWGDLI